MDEPQTGLASNYSVSVNGFLYRKQNLAYLLACLGTITGNHPVTLHINLAPLLAIVAGVAILVAPKSFRVIVAAYLIAIGILGFIR